MKLRLAITALVLGNGDDPHFASAARWLAANVACRFLPDAGAALATNCDDIEPALVVLLQSRPGEFTESELSAMRCRWPLARFVAIAGSWCEGELRSGTVAGGVYRVAWHVAVDRLSAELSTLVGLSRTRSGGGLFGLPATATIDERLLANSRLAAGMAAVVAVAAIRANVAEPHVEALAAAGHTAVYWPLARGALVRGIDAVVWDTFGCEERLDACRHALPAIPRGGPVVAVADFPRPQDISRLVELGVDRVLGKPLLIADLLTCLDELLAHAGVEQPRKAAAVA